MRISGKTCLALAAVAAAAVAVFILRPAPVPQTATLAIAEIVRPDQMPKGLVFLFSGVNGYSARDRDSARAIANSGAVVVGIDLAASFARAGSQQEQCVYFVSDMEQVSQTLQRKLGMTSYAHPIVAGSDDGGTMVLAVAAQTPLATIRRFVAVNPGAVLPFGHELCSGAPHVRSDDGHGWVYGLQPGKLPAPVQVVETAGVRQDGRAHVAALVARGFAIETVKTDDDQAVALEKSVAAVLARRSLGAGDGVDDLPLAVLPAHATRDTMAIVLSGDGGWRDIDREIAEYLVLKGVPAVGVDSLRYFWSRKSPEAVAADLARIIDHFGEAWQIRSVVLIGYSFGADVLPAAYNRLPARDRAKVSMVSLLGLGASAAFEFDVSGWFGGGGDPSNPTLPEVNAMPASVIQCIYGEDDDESICPKLGERGVQVIQMPGGHHFDNDYEAVARRIMERVASGG